MFKYEQPDTTKASKKQKEIKLLTNPQSPIPINYNIKLLKYFF